MNVLMTTDTIGGVWNYAAQLCSALATHDVHVVLATMGGPLSRDQRAQVATLSNVTVRESSYRLEWMEDPWDDVARAGDWLLGLERSTSPDVVHLNGYVHGVLPWSAPVLMVGHSCVLSWHRAVRKADAPPEWDRYRDSVRAGLHAAQLVAAPTRAMLNTLVEHYGPLPHGVVIPNGRNPLVDPAREASGTAVRDAGDIAASAMARGAASAPSMRGGAKPVVFAAGRTWDEAKNMQSLARAAADIDADVCVAGSDVHPAHGRVPLEGVHALGMLSPPLLRRWYHRAPVFVHPAIYEPFGLAPLEAALEGCALVLGDIPSLREVWGDAAIYAPARDPRAIAAAVNSLLDDSRRLSQAQEAARERAATFTAVRMADMYDVAYRTLASRAAAMKGAMTCA